MGRVSKLAAILIIACLPGLARRNPAQRDAERDRQAIEKLEHDWLDGEHDPSTLERVLAPDFGHTVPAGLVLTKQQHVAWSVAHPRPAGRIARFEILRISLYGDAALARGIVEESSQSGSDLQRTIFTDVFAYRNGVWQAVSAQENPILPAR